MERGPGVLPVLTGRLGGEGSVHTAGRKINGEGDWAATASSPAGHESLKGRGVVALDCDVGAGGANSAHVSGAVTVDRDGAATRGDLPEPCVAYLPNERTAASVRLPLPLCLNQGDRSHRQGWNRGR